jgi:hypothetical protein
MKLAHQKYVSRIIAKRTLSNTKRCAMKQLMDLKMLGDPHELAW